jgi:hypothetical protein
MTTNAAQPAMQWAMYGPGSTIEFRGLQHDEGYGLSVTRDQVTVVVAEARNLDALLRRSSQLREHLKQVGYRCQPLARRASQFAGGLCWGPAAPLDAGLLESLR